MTDKLTLQDCFKYPETPIQFINNDNIIRQGYIRAIEIHSDTELEIETFPIAFYHKAVSDCKLILRDITELTDEEKQYIIDNNFMDNIEVLFEYDINEIIRNTYSNKTIKLINYFQKIGIDIHGYLKSGKAVKMIPTEQDYKKAKIITDAYEKEQNRLNALKIEALKKLNEKGGEKFISNPEFGIL